MKNYLKFEFKQRSGLTLVELLIVVALGAIVSGVAFSIHRLNANHLLESEDALLTRQNLRVALDSSSRDIRMAGSGLSVLDPGLSLVQVYTPVNPRRPCGDNPETVSSLNWFRNCDAGSEIGVRAIFGEDGGKDGPDMVTVFRAEPEYSVAVGEVESFDSSALKLTLVVAADQDAVKPGDILSVFSGSKAFLMEVEKVTGSGEIKEIYFNKKGRFTNPDGAPSGFPLSEAKVFNLLDASLTSYYVNQDTNQLMALVHDQKTDDGSQRVSQAVAIADNIEDLQLYYFFNNEEVDNQKITLDPGLDSAKLKNRQVQAVTIGLTAKSAYKRPSPGFNRPALFNRSKGLAMDNYSRLSILETVKLRNYQS
ncbi:MAG: PilW family protein [Deltaproteobacteria bacterium]|jgi:prepilin-type N-terminal cleavage/methylation domain-containing protein|nr:PilW family protein [Deltaproteobacteria bacterium]